MSNQPAPSRDEINRRREMEVWERRVRIMADMASNKGFRSPQKVNVRKNP
jgi:hypothetical protein